MSSNRVIEQFCELMPKAKFNRFDAIHDCSGVHAIGHLQSNQHQTSVNCGLCITGFSDLRLEFMEFGELIDAGTLLAARLCGHPQELETQGLNWAVSLHVKLIKQGRHSLEIVVSQSPVNLYQQVIDTW
ncbi:hypothetical protein [Roseateles oligotrophus]|uniref:Uncharacterized protein n=1 Tax=Roseateles oligotrophus TaxID=1769250 RepID=A0ABT2YDT1_9BURK|nr:hypothetical protein [Roseateles oligotrophus]MCV2368212.1 hypothetical protein [Roseateles oligotrophus]